MALIPLRLVFKQRFTSHPWQQMKKGERFAFGRKSLYGAKMACMRNSLVEDPKRYLPEVTPTGEIMIVRVR